MRQIVLLSSVAGRSEIVDDDCMYDRYQNDFRVHDVSECKTCLLALGMRRCNDALPLRTREVLRSLS